MQSDTPYYHQKPISISLLPPAMASLQTLTHDVGDPMDVGHLLRKQVESPKERIHVGCMRKGCLMP